MSGCRPVTRQCASQARGSRPCPVPSRNGSVTSAVISWSMNFEGTGICWIGATDMIYGEAQVWLDNVQVACVDLFPGIPHGSARGEVKQVGEILVQLGVSGNGNTYNSHRGVGYPPATGQQCFCQCGRFPHSATRFSMGAVRCHILNAWNYPELTWGNYMKEPIVIESGYVNRVQVQIHASGPDN